MQFIKPETVWKVISFTLSILLILLIYGRGFLLSSKTAEFTEFRVSRKDWLPSGIVDCEDISRESILTLLQLASVFKKQHASYRGRLEARKLFKGTVVALWFAEASTRTKLSFQAAAERLGCEIIDLQSDQSSLLKGESVSDTVKMISSYADALVIRHPEKGSAKQISASSTIPVINAGDGSGQHPTQALLDIFTIQSHFPETFSPPAPDPVNMEVDMEKALKIVFVGDLRYGRTVNSLGIILANFNTLFWFIAPEPLQLSNEDSCSIRATFQRNGYDPSGRLHFTEEMSSALPEADVIYMTRLQRERLPSGALFGSPESFNLSCYNLSRNLLKLCKSHVKVLHPLPRLQEIPVELDDHPSVLIFEQAANGLFVRMAVLVLVLSKIISR